MLFSFELIRQSLAGWLAADATASIRVHLSNWEAQNFRRLQNENSHQMTVLSYRPKGEEKKEALLKRQVGISVRLIDPPDTSGHHCFAPLMSPLIMHRWWCHRHVIANLFSSVTTRQMMMLMLYEAEGSNGFFLICKQVVYQLKRGCSRRFSRWTCVYHNRRYGVYRRPVATTLIHKCRLIC